jgi:hypothetical protein
VWVNTQRERHRRRRTPDGAQSTRLEALPGWTWHPHEAAWEEGLAHLRKFVAREGHAWVPHSHREDGYRLGGWVDNQRQSHRIDALDPERSARLEALPGWSWGLRESAWEEGFAHLKAFVEREARSRVPRSYNDDDGFRLGHWVETQRQAKRGGRLSDERAQRLEACRAGYGR